MVISGLAEIASAIGVERDPGLITALRTPHLIHSSTIVAEKLRFAPSRLAPKAMDNSLPRSQQHPTSGGAPAYLEVALDGSLEEKVVLIHGFTQAKWMWQGLLDPLALRTKMRICAVDAPGHLDSSELRYDLAQLSDTLANSFQAAHYVGYSMGARIAMTLAARHPEVVKSLVVVSGNPGIRSRSQRLARIASDERLAQELELLEDDPEGFASFLRRWISQPLFGPLGDQGANLRQRALNTPSALASSLRLIGAGTQVPIWDEIIHLGVPFRFIVGERDEKFRAIAEELIAKRGRQGELIVAKDCYHQVVSSAPQLVLQSLLEFYGASPDRGTRSGGASHQDLGS